MIEVLIVVVTVIVELFLVVVALVWDVAKINGRVQDLEDR